MAPNGEDPDLPLDFGGASAREEPSLAPEQAALFEEAALIGGEKLRASGFFVHVVKRPEAPASLPREPLVLVVEDEPGTLVTIEAMLKKSGFATRSATNLQGIQRGVSARPRPDVVLLDVLLPDANGFAVLERLRRHPEMSRIPVVMLTSLSEPGDVAKGLALGASGYLSKPARAQALVGAIRDVLGME